MNTEEVDCLCRKALRNTKTNFLGVFPSDLIPITNLKYPCAYVANTDPSNKPGTHWVAFYHLSKKSIEFFDSFGMQPSIYGFNNIDCNTYNKNILQSFNSNVCGHYCIYYLYQRSHAKSLSHIVNSLLSNCNCNTYQMDKYVKHFIMRFISISCKPITLV